MKTKSTKFMTLTLMVVATTLIFAQPVFAGAPPAPYFNGFETDISGWDVFGGSYNPARVASGTNGVTSASGDWHAEAVYSTNRYPATNWGGYSSTFPSGGYSTLVDIYLNVNGGYANDTRFDFTSAINNSAGDHRRDFVFNAGFYNDATEPGAGSNRFVISASNNAGRGSSYPKNPGRDPISITQSGWYTFKHTFRDNGSGVLAVDLIILDSSETVIKTWTLSDATDLIGSTVGGNRYGWFAANEFAFLAFDNSERTGINEPPIADPGGPYVGAINTSISFDGTGSSDPDGNPLTYAWEFGDATTSTGQTPLHIYNAAGIYDVCLTVNDGFVDSAQVCTYAVVYDPTGGFVTGGGWIDSPAEQTVAGFNTIPEPLAGNYPSQPYQAQQTAEFGDHIKFSGTDRLLDSVVITMSSWACETGNWYNKDCVTTPGAGYNHPLTLNIYAVDDSGGTPVTGALLASVTQDTFIPFRPSSDPACTSNGGWGPSCFNGYAFNVTFDMSGLDLILPDEVIYGLAFNTQTWGYEPIGVDGPYNSLNFALVRPGVDSWDQIGVDVDPDAVFWNTMTAGYYSDGGTAGVGVFRQDTGWSAYVPAARFLFTSPGAYIADPSLGGKATFGFVSKYRRGATVPDGNTEFQFKAGNLNFSSTSYDWLVVNQGGTNAQFKGYGTINGAGNYGFMLWAGDGAPDTFRIKIWEADTEVVIYDNGMDQPIGGGSIVVHKR